LNTNDPFEEFYVKNPNEKPDAPEDDPFFEFYPENEKNRYKEPVKKQERPENMPGGKAPWYEKFGKALSMQPRAKEAGEAAATAGKAALSGSTFGASELIPGLTPNREEYPEVATGYSMAGNIPAIDLLNKAFNNPLVKLASKSPIAKKALTSLAEMTGWGLTGAADKVLIDSFQGEMPSAEDVLVHGVEWAALDAVLKTAGLGGRFASWVLNKAMGSKKPSWGVINDFITDLKKDGIDISQTDRVTAKVLSELEKPIETTEKTAKDIKLSKEPEPGKVETLGKETLNAVEEPKTSKEIKLSKEPEPGKIETLAKEKLPEKQQPTTDLKNKKIEPLQYKQIDQNAEVLAEPYQPNEIKYDDSVEQLSKERTENLIAEVGERAETEQQLGKNIQTDIESSFKKAEEKYEPLYKEVKSGAKEIRHKPEHTVKLAKDIIGFINSLKTKPEGYQKVVSTLNTSLSDMGYHIVEVEGESLLEKLGKEVQESIPLSKSMELAQRLNKIADYDIIGPSIKNNLKRVVSSLKSEIKETLKNASPKLYKKFINAEGLYSNTAKTFGTDAITGMRGQQKAEKIASSLLEPSVLENLKKIVSEPQYNEIQREILQRLRNMPFEKAKNTLREITPYLDKKTQDAARSIITHNAPKPSPTRAEQIKTGVFNELDKAFSSGKRPEKVLNLWKNEKGQRLIKESIESSPNKNEILDYLKKQSLYDFANSVTDKTGAINFEKFQEYLKDPAFVENLRMLGGEEAVSFFRALDKMDSIIKFNLKRIEQLPSSYLKLGEKEILLYPKKGTYKVGEEKLTKAVEKAKTPTKEVSRFKETHPELTKQQIKEKETSIRERRLPQLKRAAEKTKTPTKEVSKFKETHPELTKEQIKEKETSVKARGLSKLKKAARNREPFKFKLEELSDKYGFTPTIKTVLATFGILTYKKATIALAGGKVLYKLATRPSSRRSIKKIVDASNIAKKSPHNIMPLMVSFLDLDDEFSD